MLPLLLKGQGDPVDWLHPWEQSQGHAPCWTLPAFPSPHLPTPTPIPGLSPPLEMRKRVTQSYIPAEGSPSPTDSPNGRLRSTIKGLSPLKVVFRAGVGFDAGIGGTGILSSSRHLLTLLQALILQVP